MRRRMMHSTLLACSVAFGAWAPNAIADDQKHDNKQQQEQRHATAGDKQKGGEPTEFIRGALDANKLEIQAAELALKRAEHEQVKDLARSIAERHKEMQRDLKKIAANHNVQDPSALNERHQEKLDKLKQAQGREFDKVYISHVIQDHQRDIAALKECAGKFENMPELQSLIQRSLPTLQEHLARARNINQNAQLGIAADVADTDSAQGAAAAAETDTSRDFDGDVDEDADVDLDANVDTDAEVNADADSDGDENYGPGTGLESRKGDGEVLGLPTSNNDGTILGILPAPSATVNAGDERSYIAEELQDGKVDPQVDNTRDADTDTVVETDLSQERK